MSAADGWVVEGPQAPNGRAVDVPGDKSITHRALLLAALAEGRSRIEGPLLAGDALATRGVLAGWGVEVTEGAPGSGGKVAWEVRGRGLRGLVAPQGPLDCGRSGTTLRLAAGIAAGQGVRARRAAAEREQEQGQERARMSSQG